MYENITAALATELWVAQSNDDAVEEGKVLKKLFPSRGAINGLDTTIIKSFFCKIVTGITDCWHWCGYRDKTGYGRMGVRTFTNQNFAHRWSYEIFKGEIPKGMKILHQCDNPSCVNPDHLFLGTQKDNVRDMMKKGRGQSTEKRSERMTGEKSPVGKLTEKDVLLMREFYETGEFYYHEIAKLFGVSTMSAHRAIKKISWRHI